MKLFQREEQPKRTIEEILTPREVVESESEKVAEGTEEVVQSNIEYETAEEFTENALNCFGWKEVKTEKWLVKCAKVWYGIASLFWFLFGAVTFAPIVFMTNKVNAIFKNKKLSLLVSIGIYTLILATIVLLIMLRTL